MSTRRTIQLPVVFDAANRKKDRSLSLRLTTTQEIPNPEFAEIDKSVGRIGWLLFTENEFTDADIPKEAAPSERGDKSPSQRLRAVLFVRWQQLGSEGDFDVFYRSAMSYFIDPVKEKLD